MVPEKVLKGAEAYQRHLSQSRCIIVIIGTYSLHFLDSPTKLFDRLHRYIDDQHGRVIGDVQLGGGGRRSRHHAGPLGPVPAELGRRGRRREQIAEFGAGGEQRAQRGGRRQGHLHAVRNVDRGTGTCR